MATSSQDTSKASSDDASGSNEVSILAGETYDDKLTPGEDHGDVSDEHKIANCIPKEAREAASDPVEALLQAIRDQRSEDVLRSYLNSIFEKIGDGADEAKNAKDGEIEELGVSPGLARRGRVYNKALGEAKEDSVIEAFLLRTIDIDNQLATCLRAGTSCRKIWCWAARHNMVNIAMALVRRNIEIALEDLERAIAIPLVYLNKALSLEVLNIARAIAMALVRLNIAMPLEDRKRAIAMALEDPNIAMALEELNMAIPLEDLEYLKGEIAMALDNRKPNPLPEEVLAIAVEYGHVELVERLTKLQHGVDVNKGRWDFPGAGGWTNAGPGIVPRRLTDDSHLDEYERHRFKFLVPICSAARMGNVEMVKTLSECDKITDVEWVLLWDAIMGHHHVVRELLNSKREVDVNKPVYNMTDPILRDPSSTGSHVFSPLHIDEVKVICEERLRRSRANTASEGGVTAVEMAADMGHVQIVKILLERSEVEIAWALHAAAKKGHHDVVEELLNSEKEVDVNALKQEKLDDAQDRSSFGEEFNPLHLASIYGHASVVEALCEDKKGRLQVNIESKPAGVTAVRMAAEMGHVETVKILLKRPEVEIAWALHGAVKQGHHGLVKILLERPEVETRQTLNKAAKLGLHDVVRTLLESGKEMDVNKLEKETLDNEQKRKSFGERFNPLHLASIYGRVGVVKVLCEQKTLRANTESGAGMTAIQIAITVGHAEIEKILLDRTEVEKHLDRLYRDRQLHVDAANAILVGATLIASVTFAAWLQPPLGYSEFYGSTSIDVGAPLPSGMYPSFVSVAGHPILDIFWIFNSMSFLFAIATLMVGANAARPPRQDKYIGEVVRTLRTLLSLAYSLLTVSVGCVLGAFATAGFLVLPPVRRYNVTMGATLGIGLVVVFLSWTSSWISSKLLYVLKIIKEFLTTPDRLAP
jgi:ankyrin repeat protein